MIRKAFLVCSFSALASVAGLRAADTPLKSGLQPGDKTSPFDVHDITGPNKGKNLCYVCTYGPVRPVVIVFAREINAPLTALVKDLDKAVAAKKDTNLAAFVVFLTDNREKLEPKVAELAKKERVETVPLTIVEGVAGPEKYKVAKDAEVTVILYSKGEAKANFTFPKGKLDEKATKEIIAALPKITTP